MAHDCAVCGGPCKCAGDAGPNGCTGCQSCHQREQPETHDRRADDDDHVDPADVKDECQHGVPYGEPCEDCTREGLEIDDDDYEPEA